MGKMKNRKQSRNERVLAYFHEKVELCQRLKLNFHDERRNFIGILMVGLITK